MARDLNHITNLPVIENGFTARSINIEKEKRTPLGLWHAKHKAYACDFDNSLLRRSADDTRA